MIKLIATRHDPGRPRPFFENIEIDGVARACLLPEVLWNRT
jgi:hypothetical protein